MKIRTLLVILVLAATIVVNFALPKPKYQSTDILSKLDVPMRFKSWIGKDVSDQINPNDMRYNFISRLFVRAYVNRYRQGLTFVLLDAGNFHNPRVCYTASGFTYTEVPPKTIRVGEKTIQPNVAYFEKQGQGLLIVYWISINKRIVDWKEQKFIEFWYTLTQQKKTGLMVRMEIPAQPDTLDIALKVAEDFMGSLAESVSQEDKEYLLGK